MAASKEKVKKLGLALYKIGHLYILIYEGCPRNIRGSRKIFERGFNFDVFDNDYFFFFF